MKSIAILGAGFSGLTLARNLQSLGFQVEIFESSQYPGGLIQTSQKQMLIESAAHALLASENVERLFDELGLEIVQAGYKSKKKWIFRGKPQRIPLNIFEILSAVPFLLRKKPEAQPYELLKDWVSKNLSTKFWNYLASPALQGVYGTYGEDLSATLILESFKLRSKPGKLRGSLAPRAGMGQLIQKLAEGLNIHYSFFGSLSSLQNRFDAVVIATSCSKAGEVLSTVAPELSNQLKNLPTVTLTSVTIAAQNLKRNIQGFGCLFPAVENFNSLGVIFNTDLFANRGPLESETWIFKGAPDNVLEKIQLDRVKMGADNIDIEASEIFNWPAALPLYGVELERLLKSRYIDEAQVAESEKPLYLTGNYLGRIGLAKILDYNISLAKMIKEEL